jgi:hypothetical protein
VRSASLAKSIASRNRVVASSELTTCGSAPSYSSLCPSSDSFSPGCVSSKSLVKRGTRLIASTPGTASGTRPKAAWRPGGETEPGSLWSCRPRPPRSEPDPE